MVPFCSIFFAYDPTSCNKLGALKPSRVSCSLCDTSYFMVHCFCAYYSSDARLLKVSVILFSHPKSHLRTRTDIYIDISVRDKRAWCRIVSKGRPAAIINLPKVRWYYPSTLFIDEIHDSNKILGQFLLFDACLKNSTRCSSIVLTSANSRMINYFLIFCIQHP